SLPVEMKAAESALLEADFSEAAHRAERASVLAKADADPLRLLAAIYDEQRDIPNAQRIYALLKKRAPTRKSKATPLSIGERPRSGTAAFVAATTLHVRAKPAPDAKIAGDLEINDQVTVDAIAGDWASITFVPAPKALRQLELRARTST